MDATNAHSVINDVIYITYNVKTMISGAQLRAARALAGVNQRKLAELSGLSLPTIQRMEASDGIIRVDMDDRNFKALCQVAGESTAARFALLRGEP